MSSVCVIKETDRQCAENDLKICKSSYKDKKKNNYVNSMNSFT